MAWMALWHGAMHLNTCFEQLMTVLHDMASGRACSHHDVLSTCSLRSACAQHTCLPSPALLVHTCTLIPANAGEPPSMKCTRSTLSNLSTLASCTFGSDVLSSTRICMQDNHAHSRHAVQAHDVGSVCACGVHSMHTCNVYMELSITANNEMVIDNMSLWPVVRQGMAAGRCK